MSFERYESLLAEIGNAFVSVKEKFQDEVRCQAGCDDCCSAFFDVSYLEAEYLRLGLECLSESELAQVKGQAEAARTKTEELIKEFQLETGQKDVSQQVGSWRVRCPMLTEEKRCIVYEHRPVTCRVYGLPTSIGNKGHVCGFSGFDKGLVYPTIKLDQINEYLKTLSGERAAEKKTSAAEAHGRRYLYEVMLGRGKC